MFNASTTTPWPPGAPQGDVRTTTRFHHTAEDVPGVVSGYATLRRLPDGAYEIWLDLPDGRTAVTVEAGETFDAAIQRINGVLFQATYPVVDPTSESSVVPTPNRPHEQ